MALTLTLEDAFAAGGGAMPTLALDRRGAVIGRAPMVDWSLPDPEKIVSSRHCEIDFRGNAYLLIDTSTNGTTVNGARLAGPHVLSNGDIIGIGRYRALVALDGPTDTGTATDAPASHSGWGGWDSHVGPEPVGVDPASWDRPKPVAEISGRGALSARWAPPTASTDGWGPAPAPTPTPAPSEPAGWGSWSPPASPGEPASHWSSPPPAPAPPAAADIWGDLAASNTVDWARGGFGAAASPSPVTAPAPVVAPPPPPGIAEPAPTPSAGSALGAMLAQTAGVDRQLLPDDAALAQASGALLRRLVAGLVVMLEARTRAKAQMGAARTALQFDGNNPLKFARTPEQAVAQLLRPPERGFMTAERAVEDAFVDLQAHQVATLKAMQGALRATLDRFSPKAIRGRAEKRGILSRILPGARDAALWQAYEREYSGVAQGSDEAFMDVFAAEFRKAYDEAARR